MEIVKLIFGLVNEALTAKAEARAAILARLAVELENLDKANATEDAAHIARTAETQAAIDAGSGHRPDGGAPNPTVLVDPDKVL